MSLKRVNEAAGILIAACQEIGGSISVIGRDEAEMPVFAVIATDEPKRAAALAAANEAFDLQDEAEVTPIECPETR